MMLKLTNGTKLSLSKTTLRWARSSKACQLNQIYTSWSHHLSTLTVFIRWTKLWSMESSQSSFQKLRSNWSSIMTKSLMFSTWWEEKTWPIMSGFVMARIVTLATQMIQVTLPWPQESTSIFLIQFFQPVPSSLSIRPSCNEIVVKSIK